MKDGATTPVCGLRCASSFDRQHFLYFASLPQWHGAFRPCSCISLLCKRKRPAHMQARVFLTSSDLSVMAIPAVAFARRRFMLRFALPIAREGFALVHLVFRKVPSSIAPDVARFIGQIQFLALPCWLVLLCHAHYISRQPSGWRKVGHQSVVSV